MTKMSLYTGATQHMIGDINMFLTLVMQSIFPSNQVIILADGIIVLPLCGVDTIWVKIGIYILEIRNVLYAPRLDDTLFSITEQIKYNNCLFIGNNNTYTLEFPTFYIPAMIINEIFVTYKYVFNNNKLI